MGLILAGKTSVSGNLADQWKEYFYCDSLKSDVLCVKAKKKVSSGSSNHGSDNIISNGSVIAVADGQCMLIVEQGKVVDICAEPGEFVYDSSTEPSVFTGGLGKGIIDTFKNIGKRFTFGGEAPKDQRVYYINTKEIMGNKYGTQNPVPFRVVDNNIGLDIDITIRCFGEYSFKITNPILFYTNVCGNVQSDYGKNQLEAQMKTELLTALQPGFAKISEMGVRYSALPGHTTELADALNEILSAKWHDLRGIQMVSIGLSSVNASEEDEKMIKELQRNATFRNPNMAAAQLVNAQASAMQTAAGNSAGAAVGFMGMNMASSAGGMNPQSLFEMGEKQAQQLNSQPQNDANRMSSESNNSAASDIEKTKSDTWICSCGAKNSGKFCTECGTAKPQPKPDEGWVCSCGAVNKGKFCSECGSPKPAGALLYKCDKCGWEPDDPSHPPKFCPECGDIFNDGDVVK